MSAEPIISLGDDSTWMLGLQINHSPLNAVLFDDLGNESFNLFHLDEILSTIKETLDAQNSDGQLRMRYSNGV